MNGLIRFGESLFPYLLDTTWKATALMMLVFALNRALGKRRVAARYWLCVYCLVGVLVLPLTSFLAKGHGLALLPAKARPVVSQPAPVSLEPLPRAVDSPVFTKAEEIASSATVPPTTVLLEKPRAEVPTASEEQSDPATEVSPVASPTSPPAPLVQETVKARSSFPWKGWAGVAWLTGFTVSLLRLLFAGIAICRIRASSAPVSDSALTDLFEKAKRVAGVTARVRLSVAKTVASPVSLGMFRPSVLLPGTLPRDLPSEQLYPILLHEFAHIRSGDCAVNILERVVRSLLFFHPLVWLMSRELHSLREEVCDERVLDSYSDGVQYARVLAEVAGRNVRPRSRFLTTSCFFNRRALIERRVEHILSLAKRPSRKFRPTAALTLLTVSFAIVASLSFLTLSAENAEEKQTTSPQAGSEVKLPEGAAFEATYNHRSRGGDYGTSKLRIKADRDGAITAIAELRGTTYVASADKEHRLKEYKLTSTERGAFEWILTFEPGKVTSRRKSPDKEDEVSEIPVPKDSLYDPNSRPDPYCVADILLRQFALKEGDAKEINAYDWDNAGKGMATYTFKIEHKGKEEVSVPAGTFKGNHIVLTQLTTGDTWYKKRAGHVTDFWVLNNNLIVRILRHREPYELLLADYKGASPLPGVNEQTEAPASPESYATTPIRSFRYTNRIYSVAFSPDGKRLLAGSVDGVAKLWDVETGKEILSFSGHTGKVSSVAFSPDGTKILTGGYDKTAKLWDAATGEEIRTLSGHTAEVEQIAFSPDGSQILTASWDGTAKLWDAATAEEIRTFSGHTDKVEWADFSPDGKKVVTGGYDMTAMLWDTETGRRILTLSGHTGLVHSARFSPDGTQVLTGSRDGTAKLWDTETGKEIRTFYGHTWLIWAVAFSPDGTRILTGGGYDQTAKLWDVATGKEIRTLGGHGGPVDQVAFSPDGKQVATACLDGAVRLWDVGSIPAKEVPPAPLPQVVKEGKAFIDLDPYVTTALKGWHGNPGNNVALEPGIQRIGDSEFQIGQGAIEIAGRFTSGMRPQKLEGISVGVRFEKLEILHATCWGAGEAQYVVPDGTHIGSYVIRYEDGSSETIAIKYGVHVRDWWAREGDPSEVSEGKVAWTGENEYAWEHSRCKTRLYSMTWENPHPDKVVRAIDFSSTGTVCGPFLVAMTAEGAQPAPPAALAEPTPAIAAEGKQTVFIDLEPYFNAGMKAFSQKPGNDLTIPAGEHHLSGVDFRVAKRIIWIGGSREENKGMPLKVEGVKMGLKLRKLHFLHATCWTAPEGAQIGKYVVHYEDGSTAEIPLIYGANIRNWWIHGEPRGDISEGTVAWRGINPYAWSLTRLRVQLYSAAWVNPQPDKLVETMDFLSFNTECAPYLVALTAETGEPVPAAEAGAPIQLIIDVTQEGKFVVGGVERPIEELGEILQSGASVVVMCHPETPHETIVKILEACEKANITNVSFSVTKERKEENPGPASPATEQEEEASTPPATSPEALYVEGSNLSSQGRTEEALKAWRTLIEKFPESNRAGCAAVYMGQLQLSTKDYKGAEESFRLAAEKFGHQRYGNGVEVGGYGYFYLTQVYCDTEQYEKAAEALKSLVEKYPYSTGHRMGDALTSFRAKRWFYDKLKAQKIDLKFLDDLIAEQKDPKNYDKMNSRQLYLVAHTLMRDDKDNPTAIKAFLKGADKFPEESFTPYGVVFALQLQLDEKNHEGAKQTARLMIEKYGSAKVGKSGPVEAIGYYGLGAAYFLAEEYENAAEMFQKVAGQFPAAADMDGVQLKSLIAERYLPTLKEKGIEVKGFGD